MRLLNCSTRRFEEFCNEEISYSEYYDSPTRNYYSKATNKIINTMAKALEHGVNYVWIDSCCIDKSSSAELSEAINSMYLCRWFTRGWTLQELLAPSNVRFFDRRWNCFGTKRSICVVLSHITEIPEDALVGKAAEHRCSVAARMSWAAHRVTTRGEDIAYCLFGLFGVNLPLLYGEGATQAFLRLQEAIIQKSNDLTIFAWQRDQATSPERSGEPCSILAQSPSDFEGSGDIICSLFRNNPEFSVTNKGIRFNDWNFERYGSDPNIFEIPLSCRREWTRETGSLHITLYRLKGNVWYRRKNETFRLHKDFVKIGNAPGSNAALPYFHIMT
ncbi:HET domain-containing protein [Paraphaeosphaeria minitans]|uniref:HET domain-containing protein n=1 Tax=Paraphaeosphaeria minitans TaxID=565426 RepID=A0A9P6KUG2_9PLEO|nr:HET domain-containing protein [Paraphaeosphaeria minitans]